GAKVELYIIVFLIPVTSKNRNDSDIFSTSCPHSSPSTFFYTGPYHEKGEKPAFLFAPSVIQPWLVF
ncbi:hypothetical protein UZ35_12990, partial [Heyndrickxia coagulans]|uniref:hypothetical protein n=1 Tax=Heyndrickxia coagulans TaxID=1398 RepID=UPI000796D4FE